MKWEVLLKADFVDFYGLDKPKGWTSATGHTTVNLTGLPDIQEFLKVEVHEALHSATHEEITNASIEAIHKHKAELLNGENYRVSERGTIMKRPAFNDWLDKVKGDIGATIAFHELVSFFGTEVEEKNYNRYSTSAIDYTPQFIDDAADLWINVIRLMRKTSIRVSGKEKNPFGKRVQKMKEYRDIFSRVMGFEASKIFKETLRENPEWKNTLQDSLSEQKPETIEQVRSRVIKSKNFKIGKGMEDADFWLIAVNTKEKVGTPVEEYSKNHIGVKVLNTEKILPKYMYYHMMNLHNQGYWKQIVRGSVQQFISVQDVKDYLDRVVA